MDILPKFKRMILEPKVYALMIKSARGQVLHVGVHFTLEEAYLMAKKRMENLAPHILGETMDIDLWNSIPVSQVLSQSIDIAGLEEIIKSYDNIGTDVPTGTVVEINKEKNPKIFKELLEMISEINEQNNHVAMDESQTISPPTVNDQIQEIEKLKNSLMAKLIYEGDAKQVDKLINILDANSRKFIVEEILKKTLPVEDKKEVLSKKKKEKASK